MTAPTTLAPAKQAPATPSQSPFVVKARALEKQIEADMAKREKHKSIHRHQLEAQLADIRRVEALREAGANPRLPRGEMLRQPLVAASEKNPDLSIRWIDESLPGRVDLVQTLGYVKLSESQGGKQLGKSALYGIPRERFGELEAAKRERTASRLRSHKDEVQAMAERVVDEINSRTGGNLKVNDLFVNEE